MPHAHVHCPRHNAPRARVAYAYCVATILFWICNKSLPADMFATFPDRRLHHLSCRAECQAASDHARSTTSVSTASAHMNVIRTRG